MPEGPPLRPRPLAPAAAAALAVVIALAPAPARAAVVPPGYGVGFQQLDYEIDEMLLPFSAVGRLTVDVAALRAATGITTGFVNVTTPQGWVVQNLPVFAEFPSENIATDFMLAELPGTPVTSLAARVEYTPLPVVTAPAGEPATFPVGTALVAEGGKEDELADTSAAVPLPYPQPPPPGALPFGVLGDTFVCCQDGHSNIEAAKSQCGPAAVANSLDWLAHRHPFFFFGLPPHRMGLGADGSLVGEIETRMGRQFTDRRRGKGVGDMSFLKGKLHFLEDYGLYWLLRVSHQDDKFGNDTVLGPAQLARSLGAGKPPTAEFIIAEVCADEDVEIGWSKPGGHWEDGVCAGRVLGLPFVALLSDRIQRDDTLGTGPDAIHWSLLYDRDGDGMLNLLNKANQPEVDIVVTESPIPELDELLWFDAWLTVHTGMVTEAIHFTGTGTLVAYIDDVADRDGNGRDEILFDLARIELAGTSNSFGPVSLRIGTPMVAAFSPLPSWLEETDNATPGVLDLPPFAASGTAAAHLAVPLEVTLGGATWYSSTPLALSGVVLFKPAAPGDRLDLESPVYLVNSAYQTMGTITAATFTPRPQLPATVEVTLDRTRVGRGEGLAVSLSMANPGPAFTADLLIGLERPDGATVAITNSDPLGGFSTTPGNARTFLPLQAGSHYPTGFVSTLPDHFTYRFAGTEPIGEYVVRALLVVPGSLHDGRLDPPDVIAAGSAPFTYTGAGRIRRLLRAPH